jgi:hypothetical protein
VEEQAPYTRRVAGSIPVPPTPRITDSESCLQVGPPLSLNVFPSAWGLIITGGMNCFSRALAFTLVRLQVTPALDRPIEGVHIFTFPAPATEEARA